MKKERIKPRPARSAIQPHGIAPQFITVPVVIVFGSTVNWISENGRAKRIKIAHRVHFPTSASRVYKKSLKGMLRYPYND